MTRKKPDIKINLTPPGLPEVICQVCGGPKPPKQRCWDCYKEGRIHGQRVITNERTRLLLKEKRAPLIAKWSAARNAWQKTRRAKKARGQKARAARRLALAAYNEFLMDITSCFQRDTTGEWQLYNDIDGIDKLRPILDQLESLLPSLRATARIPAKKQKLSDYQKGTSLDNKSS